MILLIKPSESSVEHSILQPSLQRRSYISRSSDLNLLMAHNCGIHTFLKIYLPLSVCNEEPQSTSLVIIPLIISLALSLYIFFPLCTFWSCLISCFLLTLLNFLVQILIYLILFLLVLFQLDLPLLINWLILNRPLIYLVTFILIVYLDFGILSLLLIFPLPPLPLNLMSLNSYGRILYQILILVILVLFIFIVLVLNVS